MFFTVEFGIIFSICFHIFPIYFHIFSIYFHIFPIYFHIFPIYVHIFPTCQGLNPICQRLNPHMSGVEPYISPKRGSSWTKRRPSPALLSPNGGCYISNSDLWGSEACPTKGYYQEYYLYSSWSNSLLREAHLDQTGRSPWRCYTATAALL